MTKAIALILATASAAALASPAAAQTDSNFDGLHVEALAGYDVMRPGSTTDIDNNEDVDQTIDNVRRDNANLSKEELALKIQSQIPEFFVHFSEIGQDPDKRNYIVSNQRLREAGFEAKRSLDDGIRELIKGYRLLGRSPRKNI